MENSKASAGSYRKSQRRGLLVLAAAGALLAAAPAGAHRPPLHPPLPRPDDVSSVNQYVELIPTTRGSTSVTGSRGRGKLSPELAARLRAVGGKDAGALARVATLGRSARLKPARTSGSSDTSASRAFSAGLGAIVPRSGHSDALLVLVAVLAAITAASLGAAFRRRGARESGGRPS